MVCAQGYEVCVCAYACVFLKVDPGNTGRVGPTEAALFLKKSGLPDITLGKVGVVKEWIWDTATPILELDIRSIPG